MLFYHSINLQFFYFFLIFCSLNLYLICNLKYSQIRFVFNGTRYDSVTDWIKKIKIDVTRIKANTIPYRSLPTIIGANYCVGLNIIITQESSDIRQICHKLNQSYLLFVLVVLFYFYLRYSFVIYLVFIFTLGILFPLVFLFIDACLYYA